jgi:hypothetical protein
LILLVFIGSLLLFNNQLLLIHEGGIFSLSKLVQGTLAQAAASLVPPRKRRQRERTEEP